jgi:hypothetical protein
LIFGFLKSPELSPRLLRLKESALFATLTPLELKIVDGLMHERRYLPDEIIFDEGEEGQALYLVMSGRVRSAVHGASARGGDRTVARAFFGDLALLDNSPRNAQRARHRQLRAGGVLPRRLPGADGDRRRHRLQDLAGAGAPHRPAPARLDRRQAASSKLYEPLPVVREERAGPVVWTGIIAATCLLLVLLEHMLWLALPFISAPSCTTSCCRRCSACCAWAFQPQCSPCWWRRVLRLLVSADPGGGVLGRRALPADSWHDMLGCT